MRTAEKLIPLNMHEALIERHFVRDPATGERVEDHALEGLKAAAALGRETAGRIVIAHKAALANQMQSQMANERNARVVALKMLETLTIRIDKAVALAVAELDATQRLYASPQRAKDLNDATAASDTRAAFLRMSPSERRKAIGDALASGEDVTISAILNAPSVASGHTASELAYIRSAWQRQRFPKEVDRATRLDRAMDDLLKAGAATVSFVHSLTNAERIATAEASEKAAKAAALS